MKVSTLSLSQVNSYPLFYGDWERWIYFNGMATRLGSSYTTISSNQILIYIYISSEIFTHGPIEYVYFLNGSIILIEETITSLNTTGQRGSGSNSNKGVFLILLGPVGSAAEYTDCFAEDSPNKCPGYDTKQSDGEDLAMMGLWRMRIVPSLPSFLYPFWRGVVALGSYLLVR